MSVQIKEAQGALDLLASFFVDCGELPSDKAALVTLIRSALGDAQQEAAAWDDIRAWQLAVKQGADSTPSLEVMPKLSSGSLWWVRLWKDGEDVWEDEAPSRLGALQKCAAWCRAELAK